MTETKDDPRDPRPQREQVVDSMICDLIVALSLRRHQDWHARRTLIEGYTKSVIEYLDEHPPVIG